MNALFVAAVARKVTENGCLTAALQAALVAAIESVCGAVSVVVFRFGTVSTQAVPETGVIVAFRLEMFAAAEAVS